MINLQLAIDTLLTRDRRSLWSVFTQRETLRFLRKTGPRLSAEQLLQLIDAILMGPPRTMFHKMPDHDWAKLRDSEIWHRLGKLSASGVILPRAAADELTRLSALYPAWRLDKEDYADEFPIYMRDGGIDGEEGKLTSDDFQRMNEDDFRAWAIEANLQDWGAKPGWEHYCRMYPEEAMAKLGACANSNLWPTNIMNKALSIVYQMETYSESLLRRVIALLLKMPESELRGISVGSARLLSKLQSMTGHLYWQLWEHLWTASLHPEGIPSANLTAAINHAGGILTEQLIDALADRRPEPGSGLPNALAPRFTRIVETAGIGASFGRIVLMSRLPYLFQIDPAWAQQHLIPRLRWGYSEETPALWEGFMWSPRVGPKLAAALKPHLLEAVRHQDELQYPVGHNIIRLFVFLSVPSAGGISERDARETLAAMQPASLATAAGALANMLTNAGERAPTLWREVVEGWWREVWPKTNEAKAPEVARRLAKMAIAAGDAFPHVVEAIKSRLVALEQPLDVVYKINKEKLAERFPDATLELLDRIITDHRGLAGVRTYFEAIIEEIGQNPNLTKDERYRRLTALT